jgi:penicillin-insensitive murein DD-endopeptidase
MRTASVFSQIGAAVILAGLAAAALAGAEPAASPPSATAAVDEDGPSPVGRFAQPAIEPARALAAEQAPPPQAPARSTAVEPTSLAPTESAAVSTPQPSAGAAPTTSPPTSLPPASADAEADTGGTPGLKPAKVLFGSAKTPAPLSARAIGTYAKGCLAGGQALPVDGPAWQAMRLSRNRNWGHPKLIAMVQKLANDGKQKDGWSGLLVGDLAQPRGGPMLTGHASHQIGLDADIWLTPMPDRRLSEKEREDLEATSMLSEDTMAINRAVWTDAHLKIIKRAANYTEVERVLVHPAIKQVLCHTAGEDRQWLNKVRPYWGHHYHFHVRIGCPTGSANCVPQKGVPGEDGCGQELEGWFKLLARIKPEPLPIPLPPTAEKKPPKEKPPMTLDNLPSECRVVLATGNPGVARDIAAAAQAAKAAATAAQAAKAPKVTAPASGGVKSAAQSTTTAIAPPSTLKLPPPPAGPVVPAPQPSSAATPAAARGQ